MASHPQMKVKGSILALGSEANRKQMEKLNGNFNKVDHKEAFISTGELNFLRFKIGILHYSEGMPEGYCIP